MKKIILLIAVVMLWSFTTLNTNDPYCMGWEKGYCEGWKYIEGEFSVCPVAPVCPVPRVDQYKFKDGYNRGFLKGVRHAKNQ